MPTRRLLFAMLLSTALLWVLPTAATADSDSDSGPDENTDIAIPGTAPADSRPPHTVSAPSNQTLSATATVAGAPRPFIDDFRYDALVLEGTAREVCAGRLLTGSGWVFNEIVSRFGGQAGTMYYCRERWDTANDPECNGQLSNPVTSPDFYSTCWSNHAQGRAIDIMIGQVSGGYNRARGLAIVNWLLASDAQGNVNSNARKLGIQQILFDDRCWNSDGDRGISTWDAMRECGIGHQDHIHIDLTLNGANGTVSWWGYAPEVEGKLDTQVFWERTSAWRQAVSWWNLHSRSEEGLAVPSQYDQIVVGDFDRDGLQDETFLWDNQTGNWAIQNWNDGDSLTARIGTWSRYYDHIYMADLDRDGFVNDMVLWDRDSGKTAIISWSNYASYARGTGFLAPGFDGIFPADLDGDGMVNDFLAFDRDTAKWAAYSWAGYRMTLRTIGYFPLGVDTAVVGDWNAGGDLDEVVMWDIYTGRWLLYSWEGYHPTMRTQGSWSAAVDIAAPGDYDTDGRVDDVFTYDMATGNWSIYSFHRNVQTLRASGRWGGGYDVITVGSFMD